MKDKSEMPWSIEGAEQAISALSPENFEELLKGVCLDYTNAFYQMAQVADRHDLRIPLASAICLSLIISAHSLSDQVARNIMAAMLRKGAEILQSPGHLKRDEGN